MLYKVIWCWNWKQVHTSNTNYLKGLIILHIQHPDICKNRSNISILKLSSKGYKEVICQRQNGKWAVPRWALSSPPEVKWAPGWHSSPAVCFSYQNYWVSFYIKDSAQEKLSLCTSYSSIFWSYANWHVSLWNASLVAEPFLICMNKAEKR